MSYRFPKSISPIAHGCLNDAVAVCNANGIPVKKGKGKCSIVLRPGEKKFRNGWGFRSTAHNGMWVLMLTHGGPKNHTIEIAHDPASVTGFNPAALVHEMAHHLIESNHGFPSKGQPWHDRRLWGKVFGWHKGAG